MKILPVHDLKLIIFHIISDIFLLAPNKAVNQLSDKLNHAISPFWRVPAPPAFSARYGGHGGNPSLRSIPFGNDLSFHRPHTDLLLYS